MTKLMHTVNVKHLQPDDVIKLASWCCNNMEMHTWTWGRGEFQFENESDAVQFALLLD